MVKFKISMLEGCVLMRSCWLW